MRVIRLAIANISSSIGSVAFRAAVAAIQRQVREHFAPEWNVSARLQSVRLDMTHKAPISKRHDAVIYVGDRSQDKGTGVSKVYGYHSATASSVPFGFVYLDVCAHRGEEWTVTLSHEVLELLADPWAVLSVAAPAPGDRFRAVYYDLEVCDPAMGDTYVIGGVRVANFVTPAYFGMTRHLKQPTNYLQLPLRPFGVRPKGYLQYDDRGRTREYFGRALRTEIARAHRRRTLKLMKNCRRNDRRAKQREGRG